MSKAEHQPAGHTSAREKWGAWVRNGGIVAGLLGIIFALANPPLGMGIAIGGGSAAVGGEILRKTGKSNVKH